MRPYELMFIISPDVDGDEAVDGLIERFGRLVVDSGGQVTGVDKWGKKRLAYEIQGFTEGFYVVMTFRAENETVSELNRVMRITDGVIRHLTVRLDEDALKAKEAADEAQADAPSEAAADSAEAEPAQAEAEAQANAEAEPAAEAPAEAADQTEPAEQP